MALTERQKKRKAWLETILDTLEERLDGDLVAGALQMSVNGRSLQRYSLDELEKLHKKFSVELTQMERLEAGKPKHSVIRVRF